MLRGMQDAHAQRQAATDKRVQDRQERAYEHMLAIVVRLTRDVEAIYPMVSEPSAQELLEPPPAEELIRAEVYAHIHASGLVQTAMADWRAALDNFYAATTELSFLLTQEPKKLHIDVRRRIESLRKVVRERVEPVSAGMARDLGKQS